MRPKKTTKKKKAVKRPAKRRNCAYYKPPYNKKQFEEMAAKGVLGPHAKSLPNDVLSGKRKICHYMSLINEASFRGLIPGADYEATKAAVDAGTLGYCIIGEGIMEIKQTYKRPVMYDSISPRCVYVYSLFKDLPDSQQEVEVTQKPEDIKPIGQTDFSTGIYYDPTLDKSRVEKLKYFMSHYFDPNVMSNHAVIGRLLGYSEADICAFYKKAFNYARCMSDLNAAVRNGVPANPEEAKEEDSSAA